MKKLLFIGFYFCFGVFLENINAQEVSKLQDAVSTASSDRERFYALMELSNYLSYSDTILALKTLRQAYPLIKDEPYLQGIYYFNEAGIYFEHNPEKSQKYYLKANDYLKWYNTREAYRYKARLWHNYGVLEQYSNREDNFLNITLEKCIPLAEKSGSADLLIGYFTDVGVVFGNNKEFDKALEYYQKALALASKENKKNEAVLWTYLNMFEVYLDKADDKALANLHNETISLWKQYPKSKLTGLVYCKEAQYFKSIGKIDDALKSVEKGIDFLSKQNFSWDLNSLEYERVQIFKLTNRFAEAKQGLLKLLKSPLNKTSTKNQLKLTHELAEVEAKLGFHQNAFNLMVRYKKLKDSLIDENHKKMLADMELQYRTAEKEKAILQLENKNKLNRIFLFVGIFVVGVMTAWGIYAWNVQRKRRKKDFLLRKQQ